MKEEEFAKKRIGSDQLATFKQYLGAVETRSVSIVVRSSMGVIVRLALKSCTNTFGMRNIANGAGLLNMVGFAFILRTMFIVMGMEPTSAFGVVEPKMMVTVSTVQQDVMRSDRKGALAP